MDSNASAPVCTDVKDFLWQTKHDLTALRSTMMVFIVLYVFVITLGVLGNCLVIASVIKYRCLQSVRNLFIVSLSASDVVASLVSGSITPISAFTKVWIFGETLCKIVPLIQGSSLCFSTLTLTAISVDRFILIIFPTRLSIQKEHALLLIFLNAVIAISISLPMVFKQNLQDYGEFCGKFCAEDWSEDNRGRSAYGTVVFVLQFVLPFVIITFCYVMISMRLGRGLLVHHSNGRGVVEPSEQRRHAMKRRLRTNKMLIAMVTVFLLCWTPSVAFNFLRDNEWLPELVLQQEYLFGVITHLISMSSTVWNPILYTMLNEQFRFAFSEFFGLFRRSRTPRYKSTSFGSRPTRSCRFQRSTNTVSGLLMDYTGKNPQLLRRDRAGSEAEPALTPPQRSSVDWIMENTPDLNEVIRPEEGDSQI